jgi:type III secretory pathway component EscR
MFKQREKVSSTPFSDFVRNATSKEKRKLFDKVIKETVAEQREMIKKAELCN